MSTALQRELAYYTRHQRTLAQLYDGQYVVIKGDVVLAAYDDASWAAPKTKKRYAGGSYLVRKVGGEAQPALTNA